MALNFPASPTDGQIYTAEGASYVWRDSVSSWQKVLQGGSQTTIAQSGVGWFVVGDTLFQFGVASLSSGWTQVVFPQPFSDTSYSISGTSLQDTSNVRNVKARTGSAATQSIEMAIANSSNSLQAGDVSWMAYGPASSQLTNPLTVPGLSTPDTAPFSEGHDATGVSSWSIIGNTLQCWGDATAGVVTFGRSFAQAPAVTVGGAGDASFSAKDATTVTLAGTGTISWHAVGEWSGV